MKKLLSWHGLGQEGGLLVIRLMVGAFMLYHGWEVFDGEKMNGYAKWLTDMQFPSPVLMGYLGKGTEWLSGLLITLGLLTRFACLIMAVTMSIITFGIGEGRIFMQEQHPFLFVVLAMVFFFVGPGRWSLDYVLFGKMNRSI
ncbi:DoxX family protein [Rhodocytophaga rosea]|uniref:DoxX family protein n=1 Tax=Rhodocytophaga rosea TaxID=2704465 RepID=A0A6C0GUI2_9BACT|nr:DoxX family protein [Rhodocytophaga rosea]